MPKYRVTVHIDSCVSVEVEAENESKALEIGSGELADMDDDTFNKQIIESVEVGETLVDLITD